MRLELQVNGGPVVREIEPQELLLDFLRDRLGLTGAKRSCDMQACGVCTVLVEGRPVSSCCFLAADAEGREVLTVEGLAERPEFERLADAFTRHESLTQDLRCISTCEDHPERRLLLLELLRQVRALDTVGHDHVGQQQPDLILVRFPDGK